MGDLRAVPESKGLVNVIDDAGQAMRQASQGAVDISSLKEFVLQVQKDPEARYNQSENMFNAN